MLQRQAIFYMTLPFQTFIELDQLVYMLGFFNTYFKRVCIVVLQAIYQHYMELLVRVNDFNTSRSCLSGDTDLLRECLRFTLMPTLPVVVSPCGYGVVQYARRLTARVVKGN